MGFYFVSIPRAASMSIHRAIHDGRTINNHKTARDIRDEVGHEKWNNTLTFAVTRNPFDRLVSWYHFCRRLMPIMDLYQQSFRDWVLAGFPHHWDEAGSTALNPLDLREFTHDGDDLIVSWLLRFERLAEDWEVAREVIGAPRLVPVNAESRGPYRDYYDDETRAAVEQRFALDLETFSYEF